MNNIDKFSISAIFTNDIHAVNLQESLNKAEGIFKTFDTADQNTKETMIVHLSTAYKELQAMRTGTEKIPNGSANIAARIFYLYGKCLYNGDMQASRRMFELSLTLTLFSLKELNADAIPNLPTIDLKDLPARFPSASRDFQPLDDYIARHSADSLAEIFYKQGDEKAFDIAMTFRWLGATYQNITDFKKEEYYPLFEKIYAICTKTWEKINTPDSLWEAGSLLYNTGRFMHYLKHPDDIKGALETLKGVEPYLKAEGEDSLRAKQLRAQIHNITSVEYAKVPTNTTEEKQASLQYQYDEVSRANEIISSDTRFNHFLQKNMLHNKAVIASDCIKEGLSVVDMDVLNGWFADILSYMETEKYNNYYFAGWLKNVANFELQQNNLQAAKQHIEKAEEVAEMYPSSTAEILKKIADVKNKILEASNIIS
jgi:hypothetical protein